MKKSIASKILLAILVLAMLMSVLPLAAMAAAGDSYVLEASALTAFAAGAKTDGATEVAGTDGYFTLHWSEKTKVDGSKKDFADGYHSEQRINFGGTTQWLKDEDGNKTGKVKNAVEFTTEGPAEVKLWWVQAGGKDGKANRANIVFDKDGKVVAQDNGADKGNGEIVVSTISLEKAGQYFLGTNEGGCNYLFKIQVTEKAATAEPQGPKNGDKILIKSVSENKYVTSEEYNYNDKKIELVLNADVAKAMTLTLKITDGVVTFVTNDGKYLFCDGNDVKLVAEEGEYTKFTLEQTTGGYFIKSSAIAYNKAQYLEVYKGYLTCYGMGTDTSIYTFALETVAAENPDSGDATPVILLAVVAMMAMGAMLVLRKQKSW